MKRLRVLTLALFVAGAAFAQEQSVSAPECLVGQKLEFRDDDGRSFSRVISSRESDLCVVGGATKSYYDKDWVLVKVSEQDGSHSYIERSDAPKHWADVDAFSFGCG